MEKMDARPWTLKDCKDRSARPAKFSPEDLILTDEEIATSTVTPSEPPAKSTPHSSTNALKGEQIFRMNKKEEGSCPMRPGQR